MIMPLEYYSQRVVAIKQTSHPFHKIRALVISRDCSIRLVTPPTGDVMTTLLLDPSRGIVDAAYAIAEGNVLVSKSSRYSAVSVKLRSLDIWSWMSGRFWD